MTIATHSTCTILIFACSSGAKPNTECKENIESRVGLESNLTESQADSESKKRLESHFDTLDSNTESSSIDSKDSQKQIMESNLSESKQLTQSTTPKILTRLCQIK